MRSIAYLMGAAAAVGGVVVAVAPTTAAQAREPLCRRAPDLPRLGAEVAANQQQQRYEYGSPIGTPPPPAAPPPPTAPSAERDATASEIAVTGSRTAPTPQARAPMAPPPPVVAAPATRSVSADSVATGSVPVGPQRFRPPAGLLTAGDHDDLLNPLLYARYAARAARDLGQQVTGLPSVDTRRTLSIAVRDSGGRARPFMPVTITCADGNSLTLNTLADGRVVLFQRSIG